MPRSVWYYRSKRDDTSVIELLDQLSDERPEEGFWKLYDRIRNSGVIWNHKRVHRVYKLMRLNLKRKKKRRLPKRVSEQISVPEYLNHTWSMDFMADVLTTGRKFRVLTLLDDYNREGLALEIDTSLGAERVIRVLNRIITSRGKPQRIRVDNGPEFTSKALKKWSMENKVEIKFIQPGKPTQNAFIERFNGTFRRAILDAYLFDSLTQVRSLSQSWLWDYNQKRPHDSLGRISPINYAKKSLKQNKIEALAGQAGLICPG